jgi:hypothetical protein
MPILKIVKSSDDSLGDDSLTHLSDLKSECSFNRTDIINLPEQIREIALKSQSKRIYFDLDSFMSDADSHLFHLHVS